MNYNKIYSEVFQTCASYNSQKVNINYALPLVYLMKNEQKISSHIDISSGRGNFLNLIRQKTNIKSTFTDIKRFNDLDNDFIQVDLSNKQSLNKLYNYQFDVLTCLDVLQHIEYQHIDSILQCFSKVSQVCLLTIANHQDIWNGNRLHVIVQNIQFWNKKIQQYFVINKSSIHLENKLFYFQLERKQ